MNRAEALAGLLRRLRALNYRFTTVTPATHARIVARPPPPPPSLRDIFGWSRAFQADNLDPGLLNLLGEADGLIESSAGLRSAYRVSSLGDELFLHSAYPTEDAESVFFGPDTYRFARFIGAALPELRRPATIIDLGAGSGAGGIAAAKLVPGATLTLVDVNPAALALAEVNAAVAGVTAELIQADALPRGADLILANPPYLMDGSARAYRDGGGLLGGELALRWAKQALELLPPQGSMLLYTGAAVRNGECPLGSELARSCEQANAVLKVEELDPDVFGEELEQPSYAQVERIAALGLTITKR